MQPEDLHSTAPLPILVLLRGSDVSPRTAAPEEGGEPTVLGLGLVRRTVIAASRAGFSQIFFLARARSAPPAIATIPDWSSLATAFPPRRPVPLIIAHAAIVAESDWLKRLIAAQVEPAAWAAIPHRIVMLAATAVPDALAVLDAEEGAYDLTAVQKRL